jgi:alpha-tubulin suppressor-like RCC1 family protein
MPDDEISAEPRELPALGAVADVFVGGFNVCGVVDGNARCVRPVPAEALRDVHALSLSNAMQGCAVLNDGSTLCWGRNELGQLGSGSWDGSMHQVPVQVSFP